MRLEFFLQIYGRLSGIVKNVHKVVSKNFVQQTTSIVSAFSLLDLLLMVFLATTTVSKSSNLLPG
jgi:hypothetical protein